MLHFYNPLKIPDIFRGYRSEILVDNVLSMIISDPYRSNRLQMFIKYLIKKHSVTDVLLWFLSK